MQFSLLARELCDKVPNVQVASIRHVIPVAAKYRCGNLTKENEVATLFSFKAICIDACHDNHYEISVGFDWWMLPIVSDLAAFR